MADIKEQKEIISGIESPSQTLATSDQIQKIVDNRVDEIINIKLNHLQDKIENRIEIKETKTTEILAIFITLFTFISVNVNIFTRVQDLHSAVWFMLLFTMCSMLLLSCLFLVISTKKNYFIISILVLVMLFLTGLLVSTKYIPSWNPILNSVQGSLSSIVTSK